MQVTHSFTVRGGGTAMTNVRHGKKRSFPLLPIWDLWPLRLLMRRTGPRRGHALQSSKIDIPGKLIFASTVSILIPSLKSLVYSTLSRVTVQRMSWI